MSGLRLFKLAQSGKYLVLKNYGNVFKNKLTFFINNGHCFKIVNLFDKKIKLVNSWIKKC